MWSYDKYFTCKVHPALHCLNGHATNNRVRGHMVAGTIRFSGALAPSLPCCPKLFHAKNTWPDRLQIAYPPTVLITCTRGLTLYWGFPACCIVRAPDSAIYESFQPSLMVKNQEPNSREADTLHHCDVLTDFPRRGYIDALLPMLVAVVIAGVKALATANQSVKRRIGSSTK